MFSWLNFLTYAIIMSFTPGPNNIMSMSNGGRLGFRRALPFNFGVLAGFAIVMLICAAFCSLLASLIPVIELPMRVLGALFMIYLAVKIWKSSGKIEENFAKTGFVSGLALQFVNPKIYIYAIVSMQAYILPHFANHTLILAGFALLLAFIGFSSTVLWSAFGSAFRVIFSKYTKVTNAIMAALLVYCAVSLFF